METPLRQARHTSSQDPEDHDSIKHTPLICAAQIAPQGSSHLTRMWNAQVHCLIIEWGRVYLYPAKALGLIVGARMHGQV